MKAVERATANKSLHTPDLGRQGNDKAAYRSQTQSNVGLPVAPEVQACRPSTGDQLGAKTREFLIANGSRFLEPIKLLDLVGSAEADHSSRAC